MSRGSLSSLCCPAQSVQAPCSPGAARYVREHMSLQESPGKLNADGGSLAGARPKPAPGSEPGGLLAGGGGLLRARPRPAESNDQGPAGASEPLLRLGRSGRGRLPVPAERATGPTARPRSTRSDPASSQARRCQFISAPSRTRRHPGERRRIVQMPLEGVPWRLAMVARWCRSSPEFPAGSRRRQ